MFGEEGGTLSLETNALFETDDLADRGVGPFHDVCYLSLHASAGSHSLLIQP